MKEVYKNCIEKGHLKKIEPSKHIAIKELKEADYDLNKSKSTYNIEDYKWVQVKSYYACFHAARSLLYLTGIKEKSHFCVFAALSVIFNEHFNIEELKNYDNSMQRRKLADYYASYSKEEASAGIEFAESFIKKVRIIFKKLERLDQKLLKKIRDSMSLKVIDGEKQDKRK